MTTSHTPAASVSAKPEPLLHGKPIPLRLTASERAEALQMAMSEDRSPSNFARHVFRLGISVLKASKASGEKSI